MGRKVKGVKLLPHELALVECGALEDVTHQGSSSIWLTRTSTGLPIVGQEGGEEMTVVYRPMGDSECLHLLEHKQLPDTQPYQTIVEGANGRLYAEKYLRGHKKVDSSPTTVVEFIAPKLLIDSLFQQQHKVEDGAISHGLGDKGGKGLNQFNASMAVGDTTFSIVLVKRGTTNKTGAQDRRTWVVNSSVTKHRGRPVVPELLLVHRTELPNMLEPEPRSEPEPEAQPQHQLVQQLQPDVHSLRRTSLRDLATSAHIRDRLIPSVLQWARDCGQRKGGMLSEVVPCLFLGNRAASRDRELLRARNIVAVVCVGAQPVFGDLEYHRIKIKDDGTQSMRLAFGPAVRFIAASLTRGAVLVHCQGGMSRSPAMVMAYLLIECGLSLPEAAEVVLLARPAVKPRPRFLEDLRELEMVSSVGKCLNSCLCREIQFVKRTRATLITSFSGTGATQQ